MTVLIFLTLLCLGMASAAPKVDDSLDAQSDLWMVNMVEDPINNAALEESPEVLEKDNEEEQSGEQETITTARNPSEYVTLQMKIFRRIFDVFKGITRKSVLKKAAKGFGKKVVGGILSPEHVGDIVYGIGKQIVRGKNSQESQTTPNV